MLNLLKHAIILTIFIVLFPPVNGWGKKQVCLFRMIRKQPQKDNQLQKRNSFPFPMIPDPKFDAHEAIGAPYGTPFILLARKNMDKGIIT